MKRKKILWLIIGIIAVAVAVVSVVFYNMNTVEYTKGAVVDGTYVNEWANLQFDIKDSWPPISDEEYASYGNENTEYGFMSYGTETGRQLSVCFEDLSVQSEKYSAEEYSKELVKILEKAFSEKEIPYTIGDFYETTIADEVYCAFDTNVGNGTVFQRICVRIFNNRAITISMSSTSNDEIDEMLGKMTTVIKP